MPSSEPPTGKFKSDGQKSRLHKRKVANDTLMQNREELFAGEFDGYCWIFLFYSSWCLRVFRLIIASQYDPWSILERLSPYLAGSASIVVHSPQVQVRRVLYSFRVVRVLTALQILSELYAKIRDMPGYLGTSLTEGFLRRYQVCRIIDFLNMWWHLDKCPQVLPGRTHPTMNTSGSGGFLLHTYKV